jgi:hypothetical protein
MGGSVQANPEYVYEPWYKFGVAFLYLEMAIAIGVTVYSLYMAFTGVGVQFKH